MSVTTGIPVTLTRPAAGRQGLYEEGSPVGDPGHYVVRTQRDRIRPSGVECPYCREGMDDATGPQWARIKLVAGREAQGLVPFVDMVPETHRVLICRPCRQVFTAPKEVA